MSSNEVAAKREPPRGMRRRAVDLLRRRWWARLTALGIALVFIAFLPVPWLVANVANPPGMAWKLDGRIQFNGQRIDPPGSWVGLTAGRPPVLAEVIRGWMDRDIEPPRDMRLGSTLSSPAMAEPAAIAIGLIAAGMAVEVTTIVEASRPLVSGLPPRITIVEVNGRAIHTAEDWAVSIELLGDENQARSDDGRVLAFSGNTFPYEKVTLMQVPIDLDVSLAGWGSLIPDGLYRNLSIGRSHGLLLALASYSHASNADLAAGRRVAATGVVRGDGSVSSIGGLAAKARAAKRVGVDVLLYPAAQRCQEAEIMERIGPTSMIMIPVASLGEAIAALSGEGSPVLGGPCV